jgi:hypothetical protein
MIVQYPTIILTGPSVKPSDMVSGLNLVLVLECVTEFNFVIVRKLPG